MNEQDFIVELNGRKIDLSKALPLKIKDWKQLEKVGIPISALAEGKVSHMAAIIFHVLHKADSNVTQEEIDELQLEGAVVQKITSLINGSQETISRPS